jgi:hypothetical protein
MPWPLTAPMFHRSMTPKRATREGCGGRDPLDVPNVKRAPIFPQWRIPAEWIGARKSDLSTILLKFALRTVSAKERKKESLVDYE